MNRWRMTVCIALAVCGLAHGRSADGTLSIVRVPNEGVPAIVPVGGSFDLELATRADTVRLIAEDGTTHMVALTWQDPDSSCMRAKGAVPKDVPAGTYAMEVEGKGQTDRVARSVFVRAAFSPLYAFTQVTDVHVGFEGAAALFRKMVETLNASQSEFVLITGDITQGGTPEQFLEFLTILNECRLPTYVCAGNHDRQDTNYQRYFGPGAYAFTFGEDGYIIFDTKDYYIADELRSQDGLLQTFRRTLKPCRWVIGATHRYDPEMGMRSQLVLFVDDPIDHLFVGHEHRENREGEERVPWGTTRLTLTPAAKNGAYRTVIVSASSIGPQATAYIEGAPAPRQRRGATPESNAAPR